MGNTNWMTGETTPSVTTMADPTAQVRQPLYNWLSSQIGQSGPTYNGEITAPMSSQQQQSLNAVDQYGATPLNSNQTFNSEKDFTNNMLNNNFDPTTSPYYQAIKAGANQNLTDELNGINSDAGGAGSYFSGARMTQDARARTQTTNSLNSTLGQLQLQNTQNQIATLPQASSIANTQQQFPLQQATALQTLGALPQQLGQNTDNALLNQFYQSQYQYPLSIGSLAAGVQQPPLYGQNTNPLMTGLGQGTGSAMDMAMMMAMMGCWVAAEVFGGWHTMQPYLARYYIQNMASQSFREFYMKHGEAIAQFIHDKADIKAILRPLFDVFAQRAEISLAERMA